MVKWKRNFSSFDIEMNKKVKNPFVIRLYT